MLFSNYDIQLKNNVNSLRVFRKCAVLAFCEQAIFARTREQNDTRVTLLTYFALVCGRL